MAQQCWALALGYKDDGRAPPSRAPGLGPDGTERAAQCWGGVGPRYLGALIMGPSPAVDVGRWAGEGGAKTGGGEDRGGLSWWEFS